ncbi:MAG: hypothetical protein WBW85_15305, partial [Terriglobales bacterium]
MITSPCDTPWEILTVASEGLGTLDADGITALRSVLLVLATAFAGGGADSSIGARGLTSALPGFTTIGGGLDFFVSGSESSALFAAIRITGDLPLFDGFTESVVEALPVLAGASLVLARSIVGVGAASGVDIGATAGAGCVEF